MTELQQRLRAVDMQRLRLRGERRVARGGLAERGGPLGRRGRPAGAGQVVAHGRGGEDQHILPH